MLTLRGKKLVFIYHAADFLLITQHTLIHQASL